MPDTIPVGFLVLGGVLLFIGFLGGNFKLFGAEVAASVSNRCVRFFAIIFGSILLIFAFSSQNFSSSSSSSSSSSGSGSGSGSGNGIISTWTCYLNGEPVENNVQIWWGHMEKDAVWACNNWRPECKDGDGCTVQKVSI
jgi:hypothetical protein